MQKTMLNADAALVIILDSCKPLANEKVKLRNALGRTLAQDIVAHENIPSFENSAIDGYAIRTADVAKATHAKPSMLRIIGESSAGHPFRGTLKEREAVRIMTGAKIPNGTETIIPIEVIETTDETILKVSGPVKRGTGIRHSGEDIKNKEVALAKGELISPPKIGVLASLGCVKVRVAQKPRVNILATGDELARIDEELSDGQIRNSSSYVLAAYAKEAGAEPLIVGIAPDKRKRLRKMIAEALDCDILLITGGVSVGKYDLVKDVLTEVGVVSKFWQVNIKPGKPLLFGKYEDTLVFGLPGNPASTAVTFLRFVLPALHKLLGRRTVTQLQLSAVLDVAIRKNDRRRHFVRGIATAKKGTLHVQATGSQSSGVLHSIAKANCLIILPETATSMRKGSKVTIEFL
jgi:molybdopterin molybdotransferase